jgi:hypothetical protein
MGTKKGIETPLCRRKTEGGRENRLATLWSRKKIAKKACAGRPALNRLNPPAAAGKNSHH